MSFREENIRLKEHALIKKLEYDWIEALKRHEDVTNVNDLNLITLKS